MKKLMVKATILEEGRRAHEVLFDLREDAEHYKEMMEKIPGVRVCVNKWSWQVEIED